MLIPLLVTRQNVIHMHVASKTSGPAVDVTMRERVAPFGGWQGREADFSTPSGLFRRLSRQAVGHHYSSDRASVCVVKAEKLAQNRSMF